MRSDTVSIAETTLFTVVTYGGTVRDAPCMESLRDIAEQLGVSLTVALFDNSPEPSAPPPSGELDVLYRHQPANPGVGPSYNRAAEIAVRRGSRWLLLLDQDARPAVKMLESVGEGLRRHPGQTLFCPVSRMPDGTIISPFRIRWGRPVTLRSVSPGTMGTRGTGVINSGMLIRTDAFRRAGGYHPEIPLDFSDWMFLWRYGRIFPSFAVCAHTLTHSLDSATETDPRKAAVRFSSFCRGARVYGRETGQTVRMLIYAALRCAHLTLRFRSLGFLRTLLKRFGPGHSSSRSETVVAPDGDHTTYG